MLVKGAPEVKSIQLHNTHLFLSQIQKKCSKANAQQAAITELLKRFTMINGTSFKEDNI